MNISIGNLGGSNPSVNELISQLVSKRTQSLNSLLEQKSSIENTLAALQSGGLGIGSLNNSYSSQIASLQDTIDRLNEQYTLNANKITTINSLKKSYNSTVTSLDKYLESLKNPNNAGKDLDIYLDGNKVSSNDKVNVTVNDKDTNIQEITLNVTQLATTSKLFSNVLIGGNVSENTLITDLFAGLYDETKNSITTNRQDIKESLKLSELGITSGSFNIGSSKITIDADTDTIGSVIQKIKDAGYNAQIVTKEFDSNGEAVGSFMISGADGKSIAITSQTTNFASQMGLTVSEGNFYINGAEFNITDTTTLGSLINDINAASADNVGAKLENGKLVFVASETGEVDINVEKGTSNFTNAIGFTVGGVMNTTNLVMGTDGSFVTLTGTKDGISSTDSVANGKFTAGNFNVYYNEVDEHGNVSDTLTKVIIEVTEDDTIESIIQKIEDQTKGSYVDEEGKTVQTGLTAAVVDGHFQIRQLQKGAEFSISVEAGSSNFTNYVGMTSAINAQTSKDAENSYVLGSVKVPASGFSEGSFTISTNKVSDDGKTALFEMVTATITVEAGDTAESIAQKITDAGIGLTASVTEDGFFKIEQNNSGVDFDIKIEAGGTDFTYKAGLTTDIISTGVLSPGSTDLQYTSLTGSAEVDENTSVSGGTFKINGITININDGTISSAIDDINAYKDQTGVNAFLKDGHLVLQANETGPDHTLYIEGGTSNIGTVAGFLTKTETAAAATIGQNGSKSTLTGAYNITESSMITAGSIVINGYTINLNAGSLKDAITEINKHSSDTKVTASISNGKFVLTSTENGAVNITASAGTSNIAQVTGIAAYQSQAGTQEIIGASKTTLTAAATGLKETDVIGESVISINGQKMTLSGTLKSAINTINANSGFTGVEAYLDDQGRFVFQNVNTGSKGINFVSLSGDFTRVIGAASSTTTAGSSSQVDRTPASMHGGTTGLELNTEIIGGGTLTINGHDISLDGISSINGVINAINSAKIGVTASLDDNGRFVISALDPMQTLNVSYSGKGNFGYVAGIGSYTIGSAAGSTGTPGTGGVQGGNNGFVTGSTEFNQSAGIIGSNNGEITGSNSVLTIDRITEEEALAQGYTIIKTVNDLRNMENDMSFRRKYILMNDIDLSGINWDPIGDRNNAFQADFDGNGYAIKNLTIDAPDGMPNQYAGLFANVGGMISADHTQTIQNLRIENVDIQANTTAAALAGQANAVNIKNVYVSGSVTSIRNNAAGLVAYSNAGNVHYDNVHFTGNVTDLSDDMNQGQVSGIAYLSNNSSIKNSSFTGNISGSTNIGGISAQIYANTTIENVSVQGTISGIHDIGGVTSHFHGGTNNTFNNIYINADISSSNDTFTNVSTGGFAGSISGYTSASLSNIYIDGSINDLKHSNTAGLIGFIYNATNPGIELSLDNIVFNSDINKVNTSEYATDGILIGGVSYEDIPIDFSYNNIYYNSTKNTGLSLIGAPTADEVFGSISATALTTNQMKDISNFTGFDSSVWSESESGISPVNIQSEMYANVSAGNIVINGETISISAGGIVAAVNAINAAYSTTGVVASINENGNVVLQNADGSDKQIVIESCTSNFLDVAGIETIASTQRLSESEAIAQGYTIIKTANDLKNIENNRSGKYILMNDIDLSGLDWTPIGVAEAFTGELNGNGYSIWNMNVTNQKQTGGLFEAVEDATIKNLNIKNASIITEGKAGILAASATDVIVQNVHVSGVIDGLGNNAKSPIVGGLFGRAGNYNISTSSADVELSGGTVGGLVGTSIGGNNITNSYATGTVEGFDDTNAGTTTLRHLNHIGGIIGLLRIGTTNISNSYASIEIQGVEIPQYGQIIGYVVDVGEYSISNSFWNKDANSSTNTAVGFEFGSTTEAPVGGSIGSIDPGSISFHFPKGLTAEQFADSSNFTGWDTDIWDFSGSMPVLKNIMTSASSGGSSSQSISAGTVTLNGQTIDIAGGSIDDVISQINSQSGKTGVVASLNSNNQLVFKNDDGSTDHIVIKEGTSNLLDVAGIQEQAELAGAYTTLTGGRDVTDAVFNEGQITINKNGQNIVVDIDANSTAQDVVDAINASDSGIIASLVNKDGKQYMQIRSTTAGADNIYISVSKGNFGALTGLASSFAAGPTFSDQPGYKTTIKSNYYIYQADSTKTFTGGSITIDGTKINAAGKTLQQVVDEINAAGLGVTATLTSAVDNNGDSYQTFSLSKTASTADASKFTVSTNGDFARVVGLGAYSTGAGVQGVQTPSASTPQGGSQLTGSFDVTHVHETEEEFEAMGYTVIKTAQDLINIKNNLSGNYVLMDDIDLSGYNFTGAVITGTFTGQFIGNGYTISNMTINAKPGDVGLFEYTKGATIASVNFKDVNITGICATAGALVGVAEDTLIVSVNVDFGENGISTNAYVGGIAGLLKSGSRIGYSSTVGGTIESKANSSLSQGNYGGLAGQVLDNSTIYNSYSTVDLIGNWIGGIAGHVDSGSTIENSFHNGTVDGLGGGIAASVQDSTIKNSFYNSNKASQDFESFDSSSSTVTMPSGQSAGLVDSDFANPETFTNAGFSTSSWDFSGDMPTLIPPTSANISAGSIVINGTTINLSAGAIYSAISKINSYSDETGVTASINENGNVVLESDGALEVKSGTSDFFAVAGIITENTRITKEQAIDMGYTIITSGEQFVTAIKSDPSGKYILMNDIDMSTYALDWSSLMQGVDFEGTLNGNGYTVANFFSNRSSDIDVGGGLFRSVENATITDITFSNAHINSVEGGLFGTTIYGSTISNVSIVNSVITANKYDGGGLAAIINRSELTNIRIDNVKVTALEGRVGGIAGDISNYSTVNNAYVNADVISNDAYNTGGIAGQTSDSTFYNIYSSGTVKSNTSNNVGQSAGGLFGSVNDTIITNAYSDSDISSNATTTTQGASVGGLIGDIMTVTIENAYFGGTISGNFRYKGAAFGELHNTTADQISNVIFNSSKVSEDAVGYNSDSISTTEIRGLNDSAFHSESTFAALGSSNWYVTDQTKTPGLTFEATVTGGQSVAKMSYEDAINAGYTVITTAEQLASIAPDGKYILMADIDASDYTPASISNSYIQATFSGTLDGNGFKIKNLNTCLFNSTEGATLTNIKLEDVNIAVEGVSPTGALVKTAINTNISYSSVSGVIGTYGTRAVFIGGLVGEMTGGSISYSSSSGVVIGNNLVGGLVGMATNGAEIKHSYSNATIATYSTATSSSKIGGIVGGAKLNTVITNTIFAGSFQTQLSEGYHGIAGDAITSATIKNNFWSGADDAYASSDSTAVASNNQKFDFDNYASSSTNQTLFKGAGFTEDIWDLSGAMPTLKENSASSATVSTLTGSTNITVNHMTNGYISSSSDPTETVMITYTKNGVETTKNIEIQSGAALNDVMDAINNAQSDIKVSIQNGKLVFAGTTGSVSDIKVNSTGDFAGYYGLRETQTDWNWTEASGAMSTTTVQTSTGSTITGSVGGIEGTDGGFTEGSFTIVLGTDGTGGTGGTGGSGNNGLITGDTNVFEPNSNNGVITGGNTVQGTAVPELSNTLTGSNSIVTTHLTEAEAKAQGYAIIKTAADLKNMSTSGKYMLVNDIDLSGTTWTPLFLNKEFTGTLDGNGYKIKNLKVDYSSSTNSSSYASLLGRTKGATIKNLGIQLNSINSSGGYIGALAGMAQNTTISNCYVTGGTVSSQGGTVVGGLVGCFSGTMTNSYSTATVWTSNTTAGGLVGLMTSGSISSSYATGPVTANKGYVGGFAGSMNNGSITNSYSTGTVNANGSSDPTTTVNIGGFIGNIAGGKVSNSYTTSNVNYSTGSTYIGSFAGNAHNPSSMLSNNKARNTVSGFGAIGNPNVQANSSQVELLSNDQFGNSSSFSGWNTSVWDFSSSTPQIKTIIRKPSYTTSTININGTDINITGTNYGSTIDQAINSINAKTSTTGVKASIKNGKFVLETVNSDTEGIDIKNVSGTFLAAVGIAETSNTPVMSVADISASEININGVDISLSASSVTTALSTINSKTAQTGVVASIEGGKFILKNQDGSTDNIYFFNNSGNFAEVTGLEQTGKITEEEAQKLGYTVIKTAQDLQNINNNLNGKYILMNNIDLSGVDWTSIGVCNINISSNSDTAEAFSGELNGNGFTISNLNITVPSAENDISEASFAGLFAFADGATFRNLNIENADIDTNFMGGILAGLAGNTTVQNVHVSGSVSSSWNTGTMYAYAGVGGLFGQAGNINVSQSSADVELSGMIIGGIAGVTADINITDSYATGTFTGVNVGGSADTSTSYAGGLIGIAYDDTNVSNSYASISHTNDKFNNYGQLIGCLGVSGSVVYDVNIENSFWNKDANSLNTDKAVGANVDEADDIVNISYTEDNTEGFTTSQIQSGLYQQIIELDSSIWDLSGSTPVLKNNIGYGYKDVSAGMININGQSINIEAGDISNAIAAINAVSSTTGVTASINENGNVVLQNADGSNKQIVIESCTSDFLDVAGIEKVGADPMASVQRLSESEAIAQGYTIIKTADDLKNISGDSSKKYILMNNIDMSGVDWTTIDTFTGTLDGNGYTIKNLNKSLIYQAGTVRNINFTNVDITDNGIFGRVDTLSNVHATGSVHSVSGNIGGLATTAEMIENSSFEGTVEGKGTVGGLAASVNGDIINSYTKGSVISDDDAGGLVGEINRGSIENSYSEADVSGLFRVGGLVGYGGGGGYFKITNSYSTGDITATTRNGYATNLAGGIVGYINDGSIDNCYATGNVTSTDTAGGLAGVAHGSIENSYATGNITSQTSGGLVGRSSSTDILELQNVFFAGSFEKDVHTGSLIGYADNADTVDVIITNSYVLNNDGSSVPIVDGDDAAFVDTSDVTEVTNMSQIKSDFSQVWDTDIWDFSGEMPQLKFAMQETPAPETPSGSVTIDITADDTVDTILAKLQDKGIDAQLIDGHIVINGVPEDVKFEGTSSFAQDVGLIGSSGSPDYEMTIGSSTSGGGYTYTGAEVSGLKGGTQLFGLTDGTVVIKDEDGNSYTVNVSSTDTVNDVLDKMTEALGGIITDAYVKDGKVIIESTKELSFDENASTSNFLKLSGLSETATIFNGYGISIGASDGFVRVTGSVSGLENGDILGGVKDGNLVLSQGSHTQTISVSSTDTVLALINKINATADFEAGLDASGHFYIQSKHESTEAIKIDTSNAVNIDEILGLTAGTFTGSLTESLGAQGHIQVTGTVGLTPDTNNGVQTGTNTIISTPHISEEQAISQGYTIIKTAQDLLNIENNLSGRYMLVNDIDLSGYSNWNGIGNSYSWGAFKGIFDGNGYTISNLKITGKQSDTDYDGGLFAYINGGAEIRNLTIKNANISGDNVNAGALAGCADSVTIKNVAVIGGSISATKGSVGGLIGNVKSYGNAEDVLIENCYSTANVSCYSPANINGYNNVGGLFGEFAGTIKESYSAGTVTYKGNYESVHVGGLVGQIGDSIILNSYSTANVNGGLAKSAGGFIGAALTNYDNDTFILQNCWSSGKVTGDNNCGGFLGLINNSDAIRAQDCYWNTTTSGLSKGYGTYLFGYGISSYSLSGLTSSQFSSASNFKNYSSNIWEFTSNGPTLIDLKDTKTQVTAGTISINGTNISISAGSIDDAIAQINAKTGTTGVVASIENNKVVFRYKDGRTDGLNIKAGSSNFVSVTGTAFTAGTVNDKVIPAANSGSGKTFTISTASTGDTFSVNITSGMTIKQLFDKINASGLYSAAFNSENKVVITALKDGMTDITFGGTSNLQSYLGLSGGGTSNVQGDLQLGTSDSYSTLTGGAIVNTDMTFSEGDFSITAGGKTETFHVAEGETITSVLNKITASDVGVSASIQNGKVVLTATTGGNVNLSIQDGTSNFVELAGFVTSGGDQIVSVVKGELATYTSQNTVETAENLGISAGDFYIHLTDADGNITDTAKIDISENEDIASIIGKINNSGLGITATVNDSGKLVLQRNSSEEAGGILVSKGSSDFTNKIGFTSGGYQAPATEYGSQSVLTSVNPISTSQKFSEGDFIISIDDNGTIRETTIDVSASDSIYDIIDKINAADAGVTASLNASNKLVITKDADTGEGSITLKKGSSDFTTIFGFTSGGIYNGTTLDGEAATHTVLVSNKLSVSGKATMASLGVTEGSFKINGVEISISSTDTIEDVIGRINTVFNDAAYKDIAVYAEFKNNQIVITTKDASSNARITIESGSTNFTEVVGFTDIGSRDNVVDMGQNAEFNIKIGDDEVGKDFSLALDLNDITNDNIYNGNNLIYLDASGNVVSSANNAAITIELKQTGETVITLGKNLLDASIIELNKFIGNFNKAMIASENEILSDDTEFAKLITNIKEALTNDVADMRKIQQQLADIGITVDIRGGMNSNMGTVRLYLDKEKYTDAFYADSQHVLDLLVGKETAIGVEDGVLTRLNNVLFPEVNNKNGYFNKVPRQLEAIQKQLKREITQTTFDLNELKLAVSGDNGTAGLSEYLEKLEEQYNFVNEAIANLNKQYATSVTRLILNQNNSGFNPIV